MTIGAARTSMTCIPNPNEKPWMARIIKSGRSVNQWGVGV
jgi:hypothetical protein